MAKQKDKAAHSLIAGTFAGAVEGAATYPTELVKTKMQLQGSQQYTAQGGHVYSGPIDCASTTLRTQGIRGLYRGLPPMLVGNAAKAGVRFLTYDTVKEMLRARDGTLSMPRMMLAGMCAGVIEGGTVVAPSETIKTRLIHDQCMPNSQFRSTLDCVRSVVHTGGIRGLYRGVGPVMMRQGANSCVRFAAYDSLKQLMVRHARVDAKNIPVVYSFALGMAAGVITVYSTMPFDVVKTRMQSPAVEYTGSLQCALRVTSSEGVRALWKGATPRLARLMFSGAIVFAAYEEVMKVLR
ncbi:hypothetical protein GGH12_000866 [Coemansia sp. RSA 1822]|nr:hypothetical protein LPJ76_000412 [Coemansia sp. RSA 638]KAJ2123264.1 hypothetical protein IW147_002794 [Coemansia sp. RSA 720]KAJ2541033.1 hypothetical protein GGF49_004006 [Coemansia sp. RSA 1853]KAJ2566316.1 hypothetical protein GGH12_000866 [Coemansia sp. RSA 1822]